MFDLDNTLVDFMRMKQLCSEAAIHAMIDAGLQMRKDKALRLLFKMYWKHGIEDQRIFERFLRATIGKVDYKILASGIVAYRKVKAGHLVPYPHVRETLIKLKEKGLLLGIVSDAPRLQAWLRLAELNLGEFFDFVIALEDTGQKKPSKLPFKAAIKKLSLLPAEILFVGDNPARDIRGAKSVGMQTALAAYGLVTGSPKKSGADFVLRDIKNLLKIV